MSEPLRQRRWALHAGLFALTCASTTWAGAQFVHQNQLSLAKLPQGLLLLADGLPFAASLIAILLTHEMGHFVAGRIHRVDPSLPFFIPLPFGMIGTLGAVIAMPPIHRRAALVDVGAAGPLAGLAVALPILAYGLHLSPVKPTGPGLLEGNSLLYLGLKYLVTGRLLPGGGLDVQLHSVAWAGWVGLWVTMINLLPIGQLDGGHIAFAFFGQRQNRASLWLHRGLLPMALLASGYTVWELSRKAPLAKALPLGVFAGVQWLVFWGLLALFRRLGGGEYHPPVADEPLSRARRTLCVAMLVVFVLIFIPIPLRPTL